MEKNVEICILYDLYGKILTDKQSEFIDNYYNNDLSLAEIAENNKITRQAVRDNIKKAEKKLFEYEEKLSFMKKMLNQEKKIEQILIQVNEVKSEIDNSKLKDVLENMKNEINDLIL